VPKKQKKMASSKTVEVKVPLTSTSFMAILLAGLLSLMVYGSYLGVKSIWNFTHPKFEISADAFRILPILIKGQFPGVIPTPTFDGADTPPDATAQMTYLQEVTKFKGEFRKDFPTSKLLSISANDLLNMGWSFCKAKEKSVADTGEFSRDEIIEAHKAKFVVPYLLVGGLDVFIDGIGNRAFDHLCGGI
jgi:hypothetical protein